MKDNLDLLENRNVKIIKPDHGELACGDIGEGRLAEPSSIAQRAAEIFENSSLGGKRILITVGATVEAIDPVRFISNHSSGKMGMALASACIQAGAETTMVVGSVSIEVEKRAKSIYVTSANKMHEAVMDNIDNQDLFICCAAVADYRPSKVSVNKLKKGNDKEVIELVLNRDILSDVCHLNNKPICIGFAAETEDCIKNAKQKLKNKNCDAIILNDVSDPNIGLKSDENEVRFITKDGSELINKNSKTIIAEKIIKIISKKFFC
jgi:phosphopantothenoylcysteine decarboxylase/phosphopantothenate--cysteine ligase